MRIDNCLKRFLTLLVNQKQFQSFINLKFHFINEKNLTCNFGNLFAQCNQTTLRTSRKWLKEDVAYIFNWIELIGPIATFPFISATGFGLNLLIILIIVAKKNRHIFSENAHERMLKYILMNSSFNMLECFLSVFNLMSECLGSNSVFCSAIMDYNTVIYIKIYVSTYLSEVMRTCALLTMFAFSLERYIVTSNTKRWLLQKFSQCNLIVLISIICLFSLATCYSKAIEYQLDKFNRAQIQEPYFNVDIYLEKSGNLFTIIISLFHLLFNDLFILVLNLIVDILLVIELKRNLRAKKNTYKRSLKSYSKSYLGNSDSHTNLINMIRHKLKEIAESEKNSDKLVIYSLVVYLACRIPELIAYTLLFIPVVGYECSIDLCPLLFSAVSYMYNLSYCTNLYFYFKFNKNFKMAFKNFFNIKN